MNHLAETTEVSRTGLHDATPVEDHYATIVSDFLLCPPRLRQPLIRQTFLPSVSTRALNFSAEASLWWL